MSLSRSNEKLVSVRTKLLTTIQEFATVSFVSAVGFSDTFYFINRRCYWVVSAGWGTDYVNPKIRGPLIVSRHPKLTKEDYYSSSTPSISTRALRSHSSVTTVDDKSI